MQVAVRYEWPCAPPLGRPVLLRSPLPILPHAGRAPLTDVADDALVPTPVLATLHPPFLVDRLIQTLHVGLADPVAVALFHANRDRIPRVGWAAAWAGPLRDTEHRWLVDGVAPLASRPLDDCVFHRRLADRALATIRLRDVDPRARCRLLGAPLQTV
jgi:hypothetical protein